MKYLGSYERSIIILYIKNKIIECIYYTDIFLLLVQRKKFDENKIETYLNSGAILGTAPTYSALQKCSKSYYIDIFLYIHNILINNNNTFNEFLIIYMGYHKIFKK